MKDYSKNTWRWVSIKRYPTVRCCVVRPITVLPHYCLHSASRVFCRKKSIPYLMTLWSFVDKQRSIKGLKEIPLTSLTRALKQYCQASELIDNCQGTEFRWTNFKIPYNPGFYRCKRNRKCPLDQQLLFTQLSRAIANEELFPGLLLFGFSYFFLSYYTAYKKKKTSIKCSETSSVNVTSPKAVLVIFSDTKMLNVLFVRLVREHMIITTSWLCEWGVR